MDERKSEGREVKEEISMAKLRWSVGPDDRDCGKSAISAKLPSPTFPNHSFHHSHDSTCAQQAEDMVCKEGIIIIH